MNKYIILILAICFIFSCEDKLNIEPEQSLSIDAAFSDENTTRASLNGAYSLCQDLDVFGAMPQIINDFMPDNVDFIGSFPTLQDINNYNTLSDNATIQTIFRDHYIAILATNSVIYYTPLVDDETFTQEERNEVIGEAKYLRGILYLNMVTLFGQPYTLDNGASAGVVLEVLPEVLLEGSALKTRNSVAEVYTQIIDDLTDAVGLLPDSGDKFRATKSAASGMLSRVYLYKEDWANTASSARDVLANSSYSLAPDYSFYNTASSEAVFSLNMSSIDNSRTGSGGWASFYNPAERGARGDCPFSQDLIDAYEAGDKRFDELTQTGANAMIYTTKFPDATNNSDDAPIQRVTEVYLNLAEALVMSTNSVNQEAIDLVNELRTRAGVSTYTAGDFASAAELRTTILDERRKELAFEGHRRLDLLRIGANLRAGDPTTGPGGTNKVVMPIPQREIDLRSSTPQNAAYN